MQQQSSKQKRQLHKALTISALQLGACQCASVARADINNIMAAIYSIAHWGWQTKARNTVAASYERAEARASRAAAAAAWSGLLLQYDVIG